MSKYIDAERLSKRLDDEFDNLFHSGVEQVSLLDMKNALMNILIEQPVVDAEEVVRCKDCKHYFMREECELHDGVFNDYDFCSDGRRRK